jgi:LDH2 family malate/lactate/ureidoglycolate dehydrogenase
MDAVRVGRDELMRFATAIFAATGMSTCDAETVAGVLVWANERGVDSHGVIRIPIYLSEIKNGLYKPMAKPLVRELLPAAFRMDCNRAPGPVCMMRAAAHAIKVADKLGIGMGLLSDPTHLGALGCYVQWVAEHGYAAIAIVAGLPFMAYHGAKVTSLATSPIAIGIPAPGPEGAPLLLDMATSVLSLGRVRQAEAEGLSISDGVAIDANGNITTDPSRATTMLPLGGAKGSGLSLMFECLTGILAGTPIIAPLGRKDGTKTPIQNAMIVVFNVANFRELDEYRRDVIELTEFVHGLPRREGFDELRLPGERGDREARLRRCSGIPLPAKLRAELDAAAGELGVAPLQTP